MMSRIWAVRASAVLAVFWTGILQGAGVYSGGDGTAENPFQIASAADMQSLSANLDDWDKAFVVTADIAALGSIAEPIGNASVPFVGQFNGQEHAIGRFEIYTGADNAGLFGLLGMDGRIENLTLTDPNVIISSANNVGALVGQNVGGTVANCKIRCNFGGNVSGYNNVGGLIGLNAGTVTNCSASINVVGRSYVGGLVGRDQGTTSSSSAAGSVDGTGQVGGLIGQAEGQVSMCYSDCVVSGSSYVGGLIGKNAGASVADSCNVGDVSGSSYVGGFVGYNSSAIISGCYTGAQTTPGGYSGAFAGKNSRGSFVDCFWDAEVAGALPGVGYGGIGAGPLTGATTLQMQTMSTFTAVGWDFFGEVANGEADTWRLCTDGVSYPLLKWEFSPADWACPDGVGLEDLAILAEAWLDADGSETWDASVDLNADGVIDFVDLSAMRQNWGE